MKLLILVASIILYSCDAEDCGKSKSDNCNVSEDSFELLHEGMPLDSVEDILGKPNGYMPEDAQPIVGNLGRYYWDRFSNGQVRKNVSIIIETKEGAIVSKELHIRNNAKVKVVR